ncbi:MAG: FUSC family protein [Candidatus Auribacterota bacterium]|nr:FUSC family protein [Candidatus Auribacterota bacterium]
MTGSLRFKHSLKTALAVVIAIILAMYFRWEKPYWSGITVLVVMLPYIGASLEKSLLRLAGTWGGALAGVLVTVVFVQSPLPCTIVLAFLILFFIYLSRSNYAVVMGVGTMVIVVFAGLEDPSRIWEIGCYRCAEITLGVVVALFVNLSIWPRRASDTLSRAFQDILLNLREYYSALVSHFLKDEYGDGVGDITIHRSGLLKRFSGLEGLLGYATRESREISRDKECYLSFILCLKELFIALSEMEECLKGEIAKEYRAEFKDELPIFANTVLREMDKQLAALKGYALEKTSGCREEFLKLRKRLDNLRTNRIPARYPLQTSLRVMAFFSGQDDIAESLENTRAALGRILRENASPLPESPSPKPLVRRFKLDPDRLKFAVRITVGLLAGIYGWWFFRWPSGMQTIISFLIVVIQPRISAVNIKSISRLSGAVIGCILALLCFVFILAHLESVWWFGLLLLAVIFGTSFVKAGPPRFSYTGFQAGICFLLTVAQGYHQSFSIVPALNRVIGIMIGAFLGAIVVRLIFPPIPRRELLRGLERIFSLYHKVMAGVSMDRPPPGLSRAISDNSPVILKDCRIWLGRLRFFRSDESEKVNRLLPGLQILSLHLLSLIRARRGAAGDPLIGNLEDAREDLDRRFVEVFRCCREIFRDEESGGIIPGVAEEREGMRDELRRLRGDEETWKVPTEDICRVGAAVIAYENLSAGVEDSIGIIERLDFEAWDPEIPI